MNRVKLLLTAITLALPTINANAALYDRGNGMIYDSTQNITWLQDANYAKTSGYDADGVMTWDQAKAWSNSLTYDGISGWRLASEKPANINTGCSTFDGTCDVSYNNTHSEIGHLYFELGNVAYYSTTGALQSGYGFQHSGPFLNAQNYIYWENEASATNTNQAWVYATFSGGSDLLYKNSHLLNAWAVHDGDVAAVPVPATAWLFGSALIGLFGSKCRKIKGIHHA
jgi:hypothetical protein